MGCLVDWRNLLLLSYDCKRVWWKCSGYRQLVPQSHSSTIGQAVAKVPEHLDGWPLRSVFIWSCLIHVVDFNRAACHSSLLIASVYPDWVLGSYPLVWVWGIACKILFHLTHLNLEGEDGVHPQVGDTSHFSTVHAPKSRVNNNTESPWKL